MLDSKQTIINIEAYVESEHCNYRYKRIDAIVLPLVVCVRSLCCLRLVLMGVKVRVSVKTRALRHDGE